MRGNIMFKCEKHPVRKRPKTCPDCQRELEEANNQLNNKDIVSEEEIEDSIVEQIKEEIIDNKIDYEKLYDKIEDLIRNKIKECYDKHYKEFEYKIKSLSDIKYEHLDIPLRVFNSHLLSKLEKDGWCYKELLYGDKAKICAYKEDVVILIRVVSHKWPPKPDFKEKK
ncbi:MAG: hypothetical protein RBR68_07365 [Tenuifilaceae bacterium]|nr:hypothetical protein [Tenuifilaceae bacterium]